MREKKQMDMTQFLAAGVFIDSYLAAGHRVREARYGRW